MLLRRNGLQNMILCFVLFNETYPIFPRIHLNLRLFPTFPADIFRSTSHHTPVGDRQHGKLVEGACTSRDCNALMHEVSLRKCNGAGWGGYMLLLTKSYQKLSDRPDDRLTAGVKQGGQVSESWPSISEVEITQNIIFVQERALPHFPAPLRQWLEKRFPRKWFHLQDSIERPARGFWNSSIFRNSKEH